MIIFDESKFYMESLGEIIKRTLKEKGIKESFIAQKMNVSKQVINQIDRRKNFDIEFLNKLKAATGIDFSQLDSLFVPVKQKEVIPVSVSDKQVESDAYSIPYYDIEATAGQLNVFNDNNETPSYNISIPAFSDCDFAVNVAGHSMEPHYRNGDIIICKKLNNHNVIPLGEAYLIITDEQRLLKIINAGKDEKSFSLVSHNQDYQTFQIDKSEIKKLYLVKGKIERNQI